MMRIAVIGGGAAGFFAAIEAKNNLPQSEVVIIEKTNKLLTKVKVSGGGRCNVTHNARSLSHLCKSYPRGEKFLKKAFDQFDHKATVRWFAERGVALYTQEDQRMFPTTDDSQTIIDCFLKEAAKQDIRIIKSCQVDDLKPMKDNWRLETREHRLQNGLFNKVIIATGGSPKKSGFKWLEEIGHDIVDPVPSLFTFNLPKNEITQLPGISVGSVTARIVGSQYEASGPILITHWGLSGPAVLKLSAIAARYLSSLNYNFLTQINWVNEKDHEKLAQAWKDQININPKKQLGNVRQTGIPERLWHYLLSRAGFQKEKPIGELGKKGLNKLINSLTNDQYEVKGKTTFKEEFVTCGGVDLSQINVKTMQSKIHKNLYFAGEVMNIDGITGGFNFQSAWTTGYIAGKATATK